MDTNADERLMIISSISFNQKDELKMFFPVKPKLLHEENILVKVNRNQLSPTLSYHPIKRC
jgi:hypothetical protein